MNDQVDPAASPEASLTRDKKSSKNRPGGNQKPEPLPWELPAGALEIPCSEVPLNDSAEKIFPKAAQTGRLFVKDKVVVELVERKEKKALELVTAVRFRSFVEELGPLVTFRRYRDGGCRWSPGLLSEENAAALLETDAARNLPQISVISKCPVLVVEDESPRVLGPGYHSRCGGLLVLDGELLPKLPPLDEAVAKVKELHSEYFFTTEADRARAYASFITPGLIPGLIRSRGPIEVAEADERRAGKGYRQKMIAAAYNDICRDVTKRRGCGGIEESLGGLFLRGHKMARVDNVRGLIDSQWIEAFTDSDDIGVRLPYREEVRIDPSPHLIYISSNGLHATADLADRALIIRTICRGEHFPYRQYDEGDLLDHVRANQPYILGCIYSVLTHWINEGRLMMCNTPHRVQPWAGIADWIVQNIFDTPPLMDGHEEVQKRASDFARSSVRELCVAAQKMGRLNVELFARDLAEISAEYSIKIPGLKTDSTEEQAYKQVGTMLGKLFTASCNEIVADGYVIKRKEVTRVHADTGSTFTAKAYTITRLNAAVAEPGAPGPVGTTAPPVEAEGMTASVSPPVKGTSEGREGPAISLPWPDSEFQ